MAVMSRTTKSRKSAPSKPTQAPSAGVVVAPEPVEISRTTERLLALMQYELSPATNGVSCSEQLQMVIEWATDIIGNPDGLGPNGDLTHEQCERAEAQARVMIDHVLMAMIAIGHADDVHGYIEHSAKRRRECEAKFGSPRSIPFTHSERENLARAWDACAKASDARRAAEQSNGAS